MKPLDYDNKLVKEFGINEASDLEPVVKLSYVRAQVDEFKKVMYRNRVDAIISEDLIRRANKDENEAMEAKGRENLTNYRNQIKQMAAALVVLEQLKDQLEAAAGATE